MKPTTRASLRDTPSAERADVEQIDESSSLEEREEPDLRDSFSDSHGSSFRVRRDAMRTFVEWRIRTHRGAREEKIERSQGQGYNERDDKGWLAARRTEGKIKGEKLRARAAKRRPAFSESREQISAVITNKFSTRNEVRKRERVNPKVRPKGVRSYF